jgi:Fe2+ or Zn2+ uptake regulation protein
MSLVQEGSHRRRDSHAAPRTLAELRSSGRRLTRQRELIWAALTAETDRHLSAAEVVQRVRAELPRVNVSTVYRTLDLLVAEGLVLRTDLGKDRVFYEPAHDHRHHHVVCRRCGAVAHLHDEVLGDLAARVDRASGFAMGPDEVTLFGLCLGCRTGTEQRYRPAKSRQGARMSEHEHTHDHPHSHEHSHGGVTHSHPHTSHDHEHTEHEHEHSHGDVTHSHPHVHEAGQEHVHDH